MRNKSNIREENKTGGGMMQRKKSVHFDEPKLGGASNSNMRNKSVSKIKYLDEGECGGSSDDGSNRHEDLITRSSNYSNVHCPHCDRMFSEKASLRHIPICSKVIRKPKPANSNITPNSRLTCC